MIYEKCDNSKNIHQTINFDEFKDLYLHKKLKDINMENKIFQKYFVRFLFQENKINNYADAKSEFENNFKTINFLLTEDIVIKY